MSLLRALFLGERKARIASAGELAAAVGAGAAYLAQGAGYAYIRARSGMAGPRLMQDPAFAAAMERCKWEGFAAAAGDLILILEAELRPHGPAPAAAWRRLYREVLAAHALPEHRADTGWDDRAAEFDRRLEAHLAAPPRGIEAVAGHSARVLMDHAPVDAAIREADREMVANNLKLRFIEHVGELRRRTDWPALAASMRAENI